MARRIDIELTSRRPDGSWTWRAPGARQPRGEVAADVVPDGAKVGDVLRADAEFDLEGITVTAAWAQRAATRADEASRRIEIFGSGRSAGTGVSVQLAPGSRPRDGDDRRRGRRDGDESSAEDSRRRGRRDGAEGGRGPRRPRADAAGGDRPRGPRQEGPARRDRSDRRDRPERPGAPDRQRGPRRLQPSADYRNAVLAELRPEQLPVAEQLLRGGIPALRTAIEEQNTRARAEKRAPVPAEPLLAMAEELLPRLNLASWKDRATAMRDAGKDAPLREVRSVVAGASAVGLDDEGRTLLTTLKESLDARVTALRESWLARIDTMLAEEKVAEALRVASRAPEPTARIPADLAVRMAAAASAALSAEIAEAQWLELLDAVVASPVRRTVKPAGIPQPPSEELLNAARRSAGSVPELARLLGLPIPPPPGPRRPTPVGARRS